MDAAAAAKAIQWELSVPPKPRSVEFKARALLSLMEHLRPFTMRDFLHWYFVDMGNGDTIIKQRAAQYISPSRGVSPLPELLLAFWHYETARPIVEEAIDPIVKQILEEESRAAISCRELSIRPSDISLTGLVAKLGDGVNGITSLIESRMPRTVSWLLHATSSDNNYRRRKKRQAAAAQADHASSPLAEDGCSTSEDESWADNVEQAENVEQTAFGATEQQDHPGFYRDPHLAVIFTISVLLFVRNSATNALPLLLGVVMVTHGASVRVITTFSHLGAIVSLRTLNRFRVAATVDAIQRAIDALLANPLWYWIIDNINLYVRRGSQRLTTQNYMINATNAAIIFLHSSVSRAALNIAKFLRLRGKRAAAAPAEIVPSDKDATHMLAAYEAVVQSLLIAYCPGAAQWKERKRLKEQAAALMPSISPLDPEVTETFPVGVVDANEGSYKGLIRALELLRERLRLSTEQWAEHLRIGAGDFLTSRNIRGAQYLRQYDVNATERLETILPQSQLFHFAMRAADMIHTEHLGDSVRDPGSLSRHKDQLMRTYDVNKVDYANAKSLIRHSLIARLLDCVMILLGFDSWDALRTWRPTAQELADVASQFVARFATVQAAEAAQEKGDDILAHSIHFIIDALRFCEFESAVSHGDAGRVLVVLKYWAFDFRGGKCHNYARECVEILLRYKHEMDDDMRKMWASSWFINKFGKPGRFIASDLYLEHLNFYVKVVHLADGSGKTIDNIINKGSACVEAMSMISDAVTRFVGYERTHRRHKEAKFMKDIEVLVRNMRAEDSQLHTLSSAPERAMRTARKPIGKGAKQVLFVPEFYDSDIDSLFNKGYSTWNGQWEDFVDGTTYDPALGLPRGENQTASASRPPDQVTENDVHIVDDVVCDGYGGVGGGSEFEGCVLDDEL